ncbi:hypothetical protein [Nocardioides caricicola]|uniref:Uncharacterized protein n=1 Tax=Nocardioides caricicola TaxID=634770 RepID=A0ABW0MW17_9ACTN
MSHAELRIEPEDLTQVGATLDAAGSDLFGHAPDLDVAPDAGVSTSELAAALTSLATAVAGLGSELGSLAESTGAVSAMFVATDGAVAGEFTP